jgi:signal peptidase II
MTNKNSKPVILTSILAVAVLILGLDQLTKVLVVHYIPMGNSWAFWSPLARLFQFTFVTNTGAAFGMFPQLGNVFMVVAILVIGGIILFFHLLPAQNGWVKLSLGLQLGGAMGNLLDRINHGFVVDFVDIGFWPIFNVADLSIVCGVVILAYFLWDEEEFGPHADHPHSG